MSIEVPEYARTNTITNVEALKLPIVDHLEGWILLLLPKFTLPRGVRAFTAG